MNAISLYVSTSRLVLQNDGNITNWSDLYRIVPYLRSALSCSTCDKLLIQPFSPINKQCQHNVCKLCKDKKNIKLSCVWCCDKQKYEENIQLRILLQCYKKLCEHITLIPIFQEMKNKALSTTSTTSCLINNETTVNLIDLIDEGTKFQDDYKHHYRSTVTTATTTTNSDLTNSSTTYSILPCLYSNTSTKTLNTQLKQFNTNSCNINNISNNFQNELNIQKQQQQLQQQLQQQQLQQQLQQQQQQLHQQQIHQHQQQSQPDIKPLSSVYSVMYAESGNKITIKRKIEAESNITNNLIQTNFKKPSYSSKQKTITKRKGCRCGNATLTPGKLTCCGQRCPCYVESKSCIECKCKGCRNPHRLDGFKVRPHISSHNNNNQINNIDYSTTSPTTVVPTTNQDDKRNCLQLTLLNSNQTLLNGEQLTLNNSIIFNTTGLTQTNNNNNVQSGEISINL